MFSTLEDRKTVFKETESGPDEGTTKQISPKSSYSRIHLPPIVKKDSLKALPKQDIKILCMKCEEEVSVRQLQSHRELHQAISLFRYTMETKPTTLKQILKRRRALIKRLNENATSDDPVSVKKVNKLNLAYELLKSHVEGTGTKTRGLANDLQPFVHGYSTRLSCALAFGVCEERNERWRPAMEDRYSFKDYFCNDPQSGFFAIFDGYNGPIAAEKCARYFHEILSDKIDNVYKSDMTHQQVEEQVIIAFKDSYEEMDRHLLWGVNENSRNRWSGCSALTCLLRGNALYVANAGNAKAILCKGDGSLVTLSHDHSPWNKKERSRVKKATDVSRSERTALVNGLITSTRGLGNHGDPVLKSAVIYQPDVTCVSLDDGDQFLVLASNGVWDVFNESEALLLLDDIMPEFDVKDVVRRMSSKTMTTAQSENEIKNENNNVQLPVLEQSGQTSSDMTPHRTVSNRAVSFVNKEEKAVQLVKTLAERLVESALLAGSKENVTAAVILLKGCPLQMFLLPSIHNM